MLLSVLKSKHQVPGTTLYLWGPGPGQEEGVLGGQGIWHPVGVLHLVPSPAEGAGSQWAAPQSWVPDPIQLSSLLVPGAQNPAGPQAVHLSCRDTPVATSNWVNPQFTTITLFERGPNHRGKPEMML